MTHTLPATQRRVNLPSVDKILVDPACQSLIEQVGRTRVLRAIQNQLTLLRSVTLACENDTSPSPDIAKIIELVTARITTEDISPLKRVFNLTGTVLHTNLGRALLPDEAVKAVLDAMTAPMNLEFDLDSGKRGDRDDLVEQLLCELTGAEAATVVNNNAAAVLLLLNTLAMGREVIVSRGELVEIGGSFRIPDIMQRAGAVLREIGATNRTHLPDYRDAINAQTALLMKVHCSNYVITGFTKSVDLQEIAEVGRQRNIPVAVDLGSGTLVDLVQFGLTAEPTVRESLEAGADLVTFSGDKLLGGPQAGIIVGRADLIAQIKRNPLKRALRVGKLTLAALEPVLAMYRSPELLPQRLTTLRLLTRNKATMQQQAEQLAPLLQEALGPAWQVNATAMMSQVGSGALPVDHLPSYGLTVQVNPGHKQRQALGRLETAFRALPRPVLGRIEHDMLCFDLRCLDGDQHEFAQQLSLLKP